MKCAKAYRGCDVIVLLKFTVRTKKLLISNRFFKNTVIHPANSGDNFSLETKNSSEANPNITDQTDVTMLSVKDLRALCKCQISLLLKEL